MSKKLLKLKPSKLIKNKYFIVSLLAVSAVFVLMVPGLLPVNNLAVMISHFDGYTDANDLAPASVFQTLSITKPNTFSTCTFTDKLKYVDDNYKEHFFGIYEREILPFTQYSLLTTQTHNIVKNVLVDVFVTCPVTSTGGAYSSVSAVADSGVTKLDIFAARTDGSMSNIYTKVNTLNIKNLDLSKTQKVFSVVIPASDLESNMEHSSNAYSSTLRVKPVTTLQLHYKGVSGIESTKWTVGGQSESNLKITVQNEKFQCILACLLSNKEIRLTTTPSDGQVPLNDRRITYKIILPEWSSDQGSPSYKVVDASTGSTVIVSSQVSLSKVGNDGIVSGSLLLPAKEGRYDLLVTKASRDTAIASFNVYKTQTVPPEGCNDSSCQPGETNKCPEGYKFIDNDCFLVTKPGSTPPPVPTETQKAIEKWFECLGSQDSSCHWNYFGYYFVIGIIFMIIIILKAAGSSKSS